MSYGIYEDRGQNVIGREIHIVDNTYPDHPLCHTPYPDYEYSGAMEGLFAIDEYDRFEAKDFCLDCLCYFIPRCVVSQINPLPPQPPRPRLELTEQEEAVLRDILGRQDALKVAQHGME